MLAILLVLCICFVLRRKRNKQVGEKRVAAKQEKERKKLQQQQEKKPSGPWLGFLRSKKGGPGTGMLTPYLIIKSHSLGVWGIGRGGA